MHVPMCNGSPYMKYLSQTLLFLETFSKSENFSHQTLMFIIMVCTLSAPMQTWNSNTLFFHF